MSVFDLRLRPDSAATLPATAWFLPGRRPADWLRAMQQSGLPLDELSVFVVPRSPHDRTPAGAVVLVPGSTRPSAVRRGLGYACRAGCVLHPTAASLDPPISDAELRDLIPWPWAVFHPGAGLVGFEASDVLAVEQLCEPPVEKASAWGHAHPGAVAGTRLLSVEPVAEPPVWSFLEQGGEDIGTEPPSALPPSPAEELSERRRRRPLRAALARVALWFTARAPGGAVSETWVDRLERWAKRVLSPVDIRSAREREIARLMRLLRDDPDAGLRYALPLGAGDDAGRGVAPPGTSLARRDPDFDLRAVSDAGATDRWDLPAPMRQSLAERYREIANREIALGRRRRAAYVFAHLLGDWPAAARTLRDGKFHREAAQLYREKLGDPMQAARCLEEGGLLTEAIALYEERGEDERAGDLYLELAQPDGAERAYRRAIATSLERNDRLAAARLLEDKLGCPDEALEILAEGWPLSSQREQCLEKWFALVGRLGRHQRAERRITELGLGPEAERHLAIVRVMGAVAASYPEPSIRARAADGARVLAGEILANATGREARRALAEMRQLAPRDVLLTRDTLRYADLLAPRRPPRPAGRPTSRLHLPVAMKASLPARFQCLGAAATGREIALVGRKDHERFAVCTGDWERDIERGSELHLSIDIHLSRQIAPALEPPSGAADGFLVAELAKAPFLWVVQGDRVSTRAVLPPDALGLTRTPEGTLWISRGHEEGLVLEARSSEGALLATHMMRVELEPGSVGPALPMTSLRGHVFVALGTTLLWLTPAGRQGALELNGAIRALLPSPRHTHPRLLVPQDRGVAVLAVHTDGVDEPARCAMELEWPLACFTFHGIAVLSRQDGHIYHSREGQLHPVSAFPFRYGHPLALTRGPQSRHVTVVSDTGLWVFEHP